MHVVAEGVQVSGTRRIAAPFVGAATLFDQVLATQPRAARLGGDDALGEQDRALLAIPLHIAGVGEIGEAGTIFVLDVIFPVRLRRDARLPVLVAAPSTAGWQASTGFQYLRRASAVPTPAMRAAAATAIAISNFENPRISTSPTDQYALRVIIFTQTTTGLSHAPPPLSTGGRDYDSVVRLGLCDGRSVNGLCD
jgi:hypothetical protein